MLRPEQHLPFQELYRIFSCPALLRPLQQMQRLSLYTLIFLALISFNISLYCFSPSLDLDNLEKVDVPTKIRGFIFRCITSNFSEKPKIQKNKFNNNYQDNNNYNNINENLPVQENVKWYNEICRIKPVIKEHNISLDYDKNYKYKDFELILKIPLVFKSAYATMTKNCLEFFDNKYNELPFNMMKDMNKIEINGLKIGKEEIEKTKSFVKGLTLENPFSYYSNDTVMSLDYIFYYSKNDDIKVVRTLNIPDMFKLFFDIGYMPNEIYPSDHLSIAADLILGGEK